MNHVSFGTLVDVVRGVSTADSRERVQRHLSVCPRCAATAARLTRLVAIGRAATDGEPPDEVVNAAIMLFTAPVRPPAITADVARLIFDSDTDVPSGQPRSVPGVRVLKFEAAGNVELELLVSEQGVRVIVAGQITGRRGSPLNGALSAHRKSGHRAIAQTRFMRNGEFRLDYEPPAAALLRFVIVGAPKPIDVIVTSAVPG